MKSNGAVFNFLRKSKPAGNSVQVSNSIEDEELQRIMGKFQLQWISLRSSYLTFNKNPNRTVSSEPAEQPAKQRMDWG